MIRIKYAIMVISTLALIYVLRMVAAYHYPVTNLQTIRLQIGKSVYFQNDAGVINLKTQKVYKTTGTPFLWDDKNKKTVAFMHIPTMKRNDNEYYVCVATPRRLCINPNGNVYSKVVRSYVWGCDISGRWIVAAPLLFDVRLQKVTYVDTPGYIARASNVADCFWFHGDNTMALWSAVNHKVVKVVSVPTTDKRTKIGDLKFDVSPDGNRAVYGIITNDNLINPLGIEYGVVNLKTGQVCRYHLNDVMAGTNPTQIVFLDNNHLLITTMNSKYFVDLNKNQTMKIVDARIFPANMVRIYNDNLGRYDLRKY